MDLTRRMALFGLGGTAALVCGSGLSWFRLGYSLPAADVPIGLDTKQLCIVRAVVEALLPADGDLPDGLSLGVHQRVDEEVWAAPPGIGDDLRSAISLIEHLPPLYGFYGRFTRLSPEERLACFQQLLLAGPGPVVQSAVALKQLCSLFYWSHPQTWPAIGYDGPWVAKPAPPASSLRYAELLNQARAS
jgi:hypothetical protein